MHSHTPLDLMQMPLEGTSLIEASAGTGKTFTIANLFLRLILEKALEVRKILVVTFTEAATKELRDRIRHTLNDTLRAACSSHSNGNDTLRGLLRQVPGPNPLASAEKRLRNALICFDEASIFTIHGFCKRVLDENAFESAVRFDTELVSDQGYLVQEITDDFWRMHFISSTAFLDAVAKRGRITYGALTSLADRIVRNPTLTLIPEAAPGTLENLTRAHADLRREWDAAADTIKNVLRAPDSGFSKSKNPFRKAALEGFIAAVGQACTTQPPPEALGALSLFTTTHIAGCLKTGFAPPELRFFDLCEAYTRAEQAYGIWIRHQYADYLKSELAKRKQTANIQSFDDLLTTVQKALRADNDSPLTRAIKKKFDAALIDEFQDTDPIQYEIFDTVFNQKGKSLFLIGDPKQSIYGFRGADIFAYIQAAARIPPGRKFTLHSNWRSESQLVSAINQFFSQAENPFVLGNAVSYIPVRAAGQSVGNASPLHIAGDTVGSLVLWSLNRENTGNTRKNPNKAQARETAATAVVAEIARILALSARGQARIDTRPVTPSDLAVLVTRNADAQLFKTHLGKLGIPAVISQAGNIFQAAEAREMTHILAAMSAPGNPVKLNTALATSLVGCPAGEILAFMEDDTRLTDYEFHLDRFADYHELWEARGFMAAFRKFMSDYQVRRKLLAHTYGERRLTNVLHLAELIHTAVSEQDLGLNGVLNWIREQRVSEEAREEQELRLERDDEAVQILTVFRSKGLQFPIVFCPFMWQQNAAPRDDGIIFHADNRYYLDIGTDQHGQAHKALAARENLSELVRLLYVALTRAQNRCYLTFGRIGTPAATALDYILTGGSPMEKEICQQTINRIKHLDEDALGDIVAQQMAGPENGITLSSAITPVPEPYQPPDDHTRANLTCRVFNPAEKISQDWKIASFSMLAAEKLPTGSHATLHRLKADEFVSGPVAVQPAPGHTFFAFPGGTLTGSCIHAIFENLDFAMRDAIQDRVLIETMLQKFGLDEPAPGSVTGSPRAESVYCMARAVLQAPLMPGRADFTLGRIPAERRIPELEFYFPVKHFTAKTLQAVFARFIDTENVGTAGFTEKLGALEFHPVQGFMRGFIDLVFEFEGKYYLLDWKTNHLGNHYADYAAEHLAESMAKALYNLQYYIYTVALHKYLASRISEYTYERHFGGVFYLFVRGIHPEHPESGIFYDRPPSRMVAALCDLFGL